MALGTVFFFFQHAAGEGLFRRGLVNVCTYDMLVPSCPGAVNGWETIRAPGHCCESLLSMQAGQRRSERALAARAP